MRPRLGDEQHRHLGSRFGLVEQHLYSPICIDGMNFKNTKLTDIHVNNWLRVGMSGDRIPVGARFSAPVHTGPGAHPACCTMDTGSFPGVKSGRGVTLSPHSLLVPLVIKE